MLNRLIQSFKEHPRRYMLLSGSIAVSLLLFYGGRWLFRDPRNELFIRWFSGEEQARQELITAQRELCAGAPFVLPSNGFIGLLYADPRGPYTAYARHQGIDIFSAGKAGETPVYAVYDGYLTREEHWISSVIIRIPDDPLQPGRQIWVYYTHMANSDGTASYIEAAFPPGSHEIFVEQGTLLGYTGDYNGGSARDVAVHLHFSIVLDDGNGSYKNELEFDNTIDPSRYLGIPVNYACTLDVPACSDEPLCPDAILSAGGA